MDAKRKSLIGALLLGLISGPAVALGASGWLSGGGEAEAAAIADPVPAATFVVTADPIAAEPGSEADVDLQTACTVDGPALVEASSSGSITEIEQAALDALQDICASAGMPFAAPVLDEVVEEVVVIKTVTVSASAPSGGDDDDEYEHEEEHEEEDDDDHEEYEEEDDDHEEYEEEDDEDDDDEDEH